MNKLLLGFLACPALVMSVLLAFTAPNHASPAADSEVSVTSPTSQPPDLSDRLDFTGFHCQTERSRHRSVWRRLPPCITALRQLRNHLPASQKAIESSLVL